MWRFAASLIIAGALTGPPAGAQDSAAAAEPASATDDVSWVRIDGRRVIGLRGIPTYPAQRRASEVKDRILAVANDTSFEPAAIKVVARSASADVIAGQRSIVSALDADATAEGIEREVLATAYALQIRQAIEKYRYERSAAYLRVAAARAAAATVAFIPALWLVLWLMRRRCCTGAHGSRPASSHIYICSMC
jgi:hypothetical protein